MKPSYSIICGRRRSRLGCYSTLAPNRSSSGWSLTTSGRRLEPAEARQIWPRMNADDTDSERWTIRRYEPRVSNLDRSFHKAVAHPLHADLARQAVDWIRGHRFFRPRYD